MLRQSFDAVAINAILNNPSVLPGITDSPFIDITGVLLNGSGIAIVTDELDACYILIKCGERLWEIHTNLLPQARGAKGAVLSAQAIEWAFANTDAEALVTHAGTPSVVKYAQYFGFKIVGSLPQRAFPAQCTMLRLSIGDWIDQGRASGVLTGHGQRFHSDIDELRAGADTHGEDALHDCYAGFVVAMVRHFCLEGAIKAERIYNEWARQAGYQPIALLFMTKTEAVMDIGDMIIAVTPDRFYRIK